MRGACPRLAIDRPATYIIVVQGQVGPGWEDWFEGLAISPEPGQPEATRLTGPVPDQAALLGILQRLYAFGLPIWWVEAREE